MIDAVADIRVPAILCAAFMYVLAAMCLFGLICKNFHDNFAHTIGLIGTIIWALGRATVLSERESVTLEQLLAIAQWQTLPKADTVSFYQFLGVVSLTLFGLGTAWETWRRRKDGL